MKRKQASRRKISLSLETLHDLASARVEAGNGTDTLFKTCDCDTVFVLCG